MANGKDTIPCGVNGCNGQMISDKKEWEDTVGIIRQRAWTCRECGKVTNAGIIPAPKARNL